MEKAHIGFDNCNTRLLKRNNDLYYSKITTGVKKHHPEWFEYHRPQLTIINNSFINKIRALHKDIRDLK